MLSFICRIRLRRNRHYRIQPRTVIQEIHVLKTALCKSTENNNIAWAGPVRKEVCSTSPSAKSFSREKLREKIKKLTTISTEYKSISTMIKNQSFMKSRIASKSDFIKVNPLGENRLIQSPFYVSKGDISVFDNNSLFRNTTKLRENSKGHPLSHLESLKENTVSKLALTQLTAKASNTQAVQILDCSFSSNFPFFSQDGIKEDFQDQEIKESKPNCRAKTPGIETKSSQRINRIDSMSPKSILKKPCTAQVGHRKKVHYSRRLQSSGDHSVQLNNLRMEDMNQSSYFNSVRSGKNNDPNSSANKLKHKILQKAKERQKPRKIDHCTLKQIIQYKNAYKSYNTKLFKNRVLKHPQNEETTKEEIAKIIEYDHQEIYSPGKQPCSMTIINSHARKPFKSIDATSNVKRLIKKPGINPEIATLYKKFGILGKLTKARPHSGFTSNMNIEENRIASGSGFRGAVARGNVRKIKLNIKTNKSKSTDDHASRKFTNK
ncbi:unnamed protein product [Moneuplotes crassus]|uniref:Uncharacterized protein n=1 Tax=Euplotes crassus TaxID=5936 RepID=A0AAD1UH92_EUPCR|nr:unnamed protein product [Moneuplotes crassus]